MNLLIQILFISAIAFALYYNCLSVYLLCVRIRQTKKKTVTPAFSPPVTILKPLKGLDDQIEANLDSFFTMQYPHYQLLFGVNSSTDPVIPIVNALQRQYPHIPSQLIISERRIGLNPKINNLANMTVHASHEYLVISDSNVCVSPDYLSMLVKEMENPAVGLVTSTIRGTGARGFGAILENLHLNTFVAGSIFAVKRLFGVSISIGKSMLFRRQTLEQIGGFERFANLLAEDHMLGLFIQKLGLEVRTSPYAIDSINEQWPWERFANRHIRWGIMRRRFSLRDYAAELFAHPITLALLFFTIQQDLFSALLLGITVLLQIGTGILAGKAIASDLSFYSYLLIPIKEFFMFAIWTIPFFKQTIEWRGHQFKVGANTRLQSISANNPTFARRVAAWLSENGNRNVRDIIRTAGRGTRKRTNRLVARFGR